MDYRIFIVSIPFLIALIFTLTLLIKWELEDNFDNTTKSTINIKNLDYNYGFIDKNKYIEGMQSIKENKFIFNILIIASLVFFLLIYSII